MSGKATAVPGTAAPGIWSATPSSVWAETRTHPPSPVPGWAIPLAANLNTFQRVQNTCPITACPDTLILPSTTP